MNLKERIAYHTEDILSNSSEVEHYAVSIYASDIARYYCSNQHDPETGKRLIWNLLTEAVAKEAAYRAQDDD